jgi:putative DNA primase/helicase
VQQQVTAKNVLSRAQEIRVGITAGMTPGMPYPVGVPLFVDGIPQELKDRKQWVPWRYCPNRSWRHGKAWKKVPIDASTGRAGNIAHASILMDFDGAYDYYLRNCGCEDPLSVVHGLGFAFGPDDPYTGCDLDRCFDAEGSLNTAAATIVKTLGSYCELSISGAGLHIIAKAKLVDGACVNHKQGVEVYDRERFFTVTGQCYAFSEIKDAQEALEALCGLPRDPNELRQLVIAGERGPLPAATSTPTSIVTIDNITPYRLRPLTKERIIQCLKREKRSGRLWAGDIRGYPSQSEADFFLARRLLYLTGFDHDLSAELFRESGLARPKLDEYRGERTYLDITLGNASAFLFKNPPKPKRRGAPFAAKTVEAAAIFAGDQGIRPRHLGDRLRAAGHTVTEASARTILKRLRQMEPEELARLYQGPNSASKHEQMRAPAEEWKESVQKPTIQLIVGCGSASHLQNDAITSGVDVEAFLSKWFTEPTWIKKRATVCRNLDLIIRTASQLTFPLSNFHLDSWFGQIQLWANEVSSLADIPRKYVNRWSSHLLHEACYWMDQARDSVVMRTCEAIKCLYKGVPFAPRRSALLRAALDLSEWCDDSKIDKEVMSESLNRLRKQRVSLTVQSIVEAAKPHCRQLSMKPRRNRSCDLQPTLPVAA